jgi:hypothetical protein
VLAPRIDKVEEFYKALVECLVKEANHPLTVEDIGFIHNRANSLGVENDEFLAYFANKPRGIIVSAQLLLEGFDDPAINAVVITYPSSSIIVLMQAAGRCVRYTPGKSKTYVLQARNDSLAYHFDQRWLYQEISDYPLPQLKDMDYTDLDQLKNSIREILQQHNVAVSIQERIMTDLDGTSLGEHCRLLLSGLPYYGLEQDFLHQASWSAILETPANSDAFRFLFNRFAALHADLSDPVDFLEHHGRHYGIRKSYSEATDWRLYSDMLTAMYFAQKEIYEPGAAAKQGSRPFKQHGATTWLKYFTFHYRPIVPERLSMFLQDCYNREAIIATYLANPQAYALVIKLPLPLAGCEAHIFNLSETEAFQNTVKGAHSALIDLHPSKQFSALAVYLSQLTVANLPLRLIQRVEHFLSNDGFEKYVFNVDANIEQALVLS